MQTLEFTRALKEIVKELRVQELISLLAPWLNLTVATQIDDAQKNLFSSLLLDSHSGC
jgi:hypothetical protein